MSLGNLIAKINRFLEVIFLLWVCTSAIKAQMLAFKLQNVTYVKSIDLLRDKKTPNDVESHNLGGQLRVTLHGFMRSKNKFIGISVKKEVLCGILRVVPSISHLALAQ